MEMKNRMYSEKGIRSSEDFNKGSVYKKGGAVKKMQKGGVSKYAPKMSKKYVDSKIPKTKGPEASTPKPAMAKYGGTSKSLSAYKTGGMVNSNAKVSAIKTAGSKGVKSGVNTKVTASKVAKGRVGGTSTAPKGATPKAKMGGMMKGKKC
jgi:hypothetical protein